MRFGAVNLLFALIFGPVWGLCGLPGWPCSGCLAWGRDGKELGKNWERTGISSKRGLRGNPYVGIRSNPYFSKLVPLLFGCVAFRFVCLSCQSQSITKNHIMSTVVLTFGKFSGKRFCDTPTWYQTWAQNQPGFMARLSGEPIPPKKPAYLDGHSRKSQDFENRYFGYEQAMADKYDPAPDPFTDRF